MSAADGLSTSPILPQSNQPVEIQKALLDIYKQIQKLTSNLDSQIGTGSLLLNEISSPGSPADGQIWYDKSQKTLLQMIDNVKQYQSQVLYCGQGNTVANSNTATSLLTGKGVGTLTIPAGFFVPYKTLRIKLRGIVSTAATGPSATFTIKLGDTTLFNSAGTLPASLSSMYWDTEYDIVCRSVGTAGVVYGGGRNLIQTAIGLAAPYLRGLGSTTYTLNTLVANKLDVLYTWGTASASNSIATTEVSLEVFA